MLLLALVISAAVLSTAKAAIGDACGDHQSCNYGTGSIDHTMCQSSTCQCTSLYYGESGDTVCLRADIGDDCSSKADGDAYCQTLDANAACVSNACACATGYYDATSFIDGHSHCSKILPGTPCDSGSGGANICPTGFSGAVCDNSTNTCECPSGDTYVYSLDLCHPESFQAACQTCRTTGGRCYDVEDDSTPEGCACPISKETSGANAAGSLTVGCDVGLARLGDYCDKVGSPVKCEDNHTSCVHAGGLDSRFTCTCEPGYAAVPVGMERTCYRSLAKETDRNCQWCESRGGVCYDIDEDGIRDGCMCPVTRSTSDPHDPSKDCDVDHVSVTCAANTLTLCYTPHNTTRFPNIATKLTNKDAYVYIQKRLGQDPCRFVYDGSSDWCVDLDLSTNETDACGTKIAYPTHNTITYNNWMLLQTSPPGMNRADTKVHVYCQFDTITHTFTGTGTQVVGFASIASEGDEVHPVLEMDVEDEFGRDATIQGIRLGQPARLIIEMTEDRSIYDSVRPEVCIASSRPELANPATRSILLLYDGCPLENSYLNVANMFYPDPADAEVSRTGLFSMFQLEDSEFIFFHCAVRVCRNDEDCSAPSCSSKRRKREIAPERILGREIRQIQATDKEPELRTLASGPVQIVTNNQQSDAGLSGKGGKDAKRGKLSNKHLLMIAIIAGVAVVAIVVGAVVGLALKRRSRPAKNSRKWSLKPVSTPSPLGNPIAAGGEHI